MPEPTKEDSSFKRKLSKREKKQLKKQGRTEAMQYVMMGLLVKACFEQHVIDVLCWSRPLGKFIDLWLSEVASRGVHKLSSRSAVVS